MPCCDLLICTKQLAISLEDLKDDGNTETASMATQILNTVTKSDFVISLFMLKSLFSLTLPLNKHLQKVDSDLSEACSNVENIADVVKKWRSNVEQKFSSIFSSAKSTLESVNSEITTPLASACSVHGSNIQLNTAEEYYRMSTYIPVLDDSSAQLQERF